MRKTFFLILAISIFSRANAYVLFDHGGVENIDYLIDDTVYIDSQQSPNPGTIVNVLPNGEITGEYTRLYHNAALNVDGGKVAGIWAFDNSTINIYDGEVSWHITLINGNAKLNIHGGKIIQGISAGPNLVEIFGGELLGDITTYYGPVKLYGVFDQGYGTFTGEGEITGTLANNDMIHTSYSTFDTGTIILAPVPEPSILCLLIFGSQLIKKRK